MEQKNSAKSIIISILFVVGFFSAMIAMVYFSRRNPPVCVFIFGMVFFVVGTLVIGSTGLKLDTAWILLFPAVGLACMVVSATYIWEFPAMKDMHIDKEKIIVTLVLLLFFVVGAGISFGNKLLSKKRKGIYTYPIEAKCIEVRISYNNGHRYYEPVLQYYYNGEEYVFDTGTNQCINKDEMGEFQNLLQNSLRLSAGPDHGSIGRYYTLMINPDNPKEAWFHSKTAESIMFGMGLVFMGMSMVAFYCLFFKQ